MSESIHDKIAKRAYKIYQETGRKDELANWAQAEYELGFALHHQEIAHRAHFAPNKKDDVANWYQALNELREMRNYVERQLTDEEIEELNRRCAEDEY
jgi:hypothetical protein